MFSTWYARGFACSLFAEAIGQAIGQTFKRIAQQLAVLRQAGVQSLLDPHPIVADVDRCTGNERGDRYFQNVAYFQNLGHGGVGDPTFEARDGFPFDLQSFRQLILSHTSMTTQFSEAFADA